MLRRAAIRRITPGRNNTPPPGFEQDFGTKWRESYASSENPEQFGGHRPTGGWFKPGTKGFRGPPTDGFDATKDWRADGMKMSEGVFPWPGGDRRTPTGGLGGWPLPKGQTATRDPRVPAGREASMVATQKEIPMQGGAPATPPPFRIMQPPKPLHILVSEGTTRQGVATIGLQKPTLTFDVLEELTAWLKYFGNAPHVNAVTIECSVSLDGLPKEEFSPPPPKSVIEQYWWTLQETWIMAASFPKVLAMEVAGDCVDGGCVLLLASDIRVVAPQAKIGLTELIPGSHVVPPWLLLSLAHSIGDVQAAEMIKTSSKWDARVALSHGLVDAVAENDTADSLHAVTARLLDTYLSVPVLGRSVVKNAVRIHWMQKISSQSDRDYDMEFFSRVAIRQRGPKVAAPLDKPTSIPVENL